MIADEDYLHAGQPLRLAYGTHTLAKAAHVLDDDNCIGIADPFLSYRGIRKGQKFWCFLKPGTVVGMRHHWTHPAFDQVPPSSGESEKWLRQFADKWNFDYDEMIAEAQNPDGYVVARGIDLHSADELGGDCSLFWMHLEALTGKEFDDEHQKNFGWSCSC